MRGCTPRRAMEGKRVDKKVYKAEASEKICQEERKGLETTTRRRRK